MLPQNKTELFLFLFLLCLALGWTLAVSLYGPEMFKAIDAILPR